MNQIAEAVISLLEKRGVIREESRAVYVYGLSQMIYTFLSTLGLLLIGLAAGRPAETALLIALFYTNQTYGGGYHANSHTRCFLTMTAGLLVFLVSFSLPYSLPGCVALAGAGLALLYLRPLTLHPNKLYLAKKSRQFIRRSRKAVLLQALFFVLALLTGYAPLIRTLAMALFLCACSRMTAILIRQGQSFP
ncbi:MAG TPA: accessory gene regulator B family protein [Candidatus Ventricola intestinavium]|nr:accessory gene regulator B family protein [Candidatus Ventricola intestinavium]